MEKFLKEHNLQDLQQAIAEQKEMDTIKQKAIADGTFMKAPNGKPTNLNERQWLQVRTTNFKNWFGDWENNPSEASKVVDENGEPLVVYHGSTASFKAFDITYSRRGQFDFGFYFTPNKELADRYSQSNNLYEVFLNLRTQDIAPQTRRDDWVFNDGVIVKASYETVQEAREIVVRRPNQIKSATNNNGNFSLTDDDIQAFVDKYDLPKGELPSLASTLMTKHGNKTAYGDVVHTANYEYTVNYKGAGEFDIIECHKIDNNLNTEYNDRERKEFSESPDRWSTRNEVTQGKYNSDSFNVENREADGDYAGLDLQASQGKPQQNEDNNGSNQHQEWSSVKRDSATGRITFVEGDGKTNSTVEDWGNIETFTTPQGEVYGFVDKDGNIYLKPRFLPNL